MSKTLDELTGSVARSAIIRHVIRQKVELGEPLTLANVGLALQGATNDTFGELGDDELAAAVAELEKPATAEPATTEPEAEAAPVEPLPTVSFDELLAAEKQNEIDLALARRIVLELPTSAARRKVGIPERLHCL